MNTANVDELMTRLRQIQIRGGVPADAGGVTDWYEVMLFPAAPEHDVASAHVWLGKRLPADFLRFWRLSNGANLFVNESGLHGVGIASTGLIQDLQEEEADVYGLTALEPYAVFARVNGAGDFLVFELATGRVLDGIHAEQPHEWKQIAGSFSEWLARFVEEQGRYYWIEALYGSPAESL